MKNLFNLIETDYRIYLNNYSWTQISAKIQSCIASQNPNKNIWLYAKK